MVLDRYDEETYMQPFWEGDTVYHDGVLFYKGRKKARLLYPIDQIISVRSFDLQTEFVEGKDFLVVEGELVLTENTTIPVWDIESFTITPARHIFPVRNSSLFLNETCGIKMREMTVCVSYKHSKTFIDGYSGRGVATVRSELPRLFERFDKGDTVNIMLYGDSNFTSWGCSGGYAENRFFDATDTGSFYTVGINVPPYAPPWFDMFLSSLRQMYPKATINMDNISIGGVDSKWAAEHFRARLKLSKHKPDVILFGFGVNDLCGGMSALDYRKYNKELVDIVRSDENGNRDVSCVFVSPHTCNNDAECYPAEIFCEYENALTQITKEYQNTAVIKLHSLSYDMSKCKLPLDRLENNINHCMDMGGRMFAQAITEAFR